MKLTNGDLNVIMEMKVRAKTNDLHFRENYVHFVWLNMRHSIVPLLPRFFSYRGDQT